MSKMEIPTAAEDKATRNDNLSDFARSLTYRSSGKSDEHTYSINEAATKSSGAYDTHGPSSDEGQIKRSGRYDTTAPGLSAGEKLPAGFGNFNLYSGNISDTATASDTRLTQQNKRENKSADSDPFIDGLKSAGLSQTAIDKMAGSAEYKDAEEFHKKFGNNPNSPEAIAWLEQKIQQQATKEAKQAEEKSERSGLAPVGDAGYFYAQALLMHIAARHPNFDPNNVHGSYFSHDSGWRGMQGYFSAR